MRVYEPDLEKFAKRYDRGELSGCDADYSHPIKKGLPRVSVATKHKKTKKKGKIHGLNFRSKGTFDFTAD